MRRPHSDLGSPPVGTHTDVFLDADRLDLWVVEGDNPVLVLSDGVCEVRITAGRQGFNIHELLGVRRLSDTVAYYLRLCNRLAKIRRRTLDEHAETIGSRRGR